MRTHVYRYLLGLPSHPAQDVLLPPDVSVFVLLVLVKQVNRVNRAPVATAHTASVELDAWNTAPASVFVLVHQLLRQYLYFCTSKASTLRTARKFAITSDA